MNEEETESFDLLEEARAWRRELLRARAELEVSICLEYWGRVVAHRAGALTGTIWLKSLPKARNSRVRLEVDPFAQERRPGNHAGPSLSPWQLATRWEEVIRRDRTFPPGGPLPPKLAAELERLNAEIRSCSSTCELLEDEEEFLRREISASGKGGHKGDLGSIQCGFLTVLQLLRKRTGRFKSLVCWLYAVPIYSDRPTDLEEWARLRFAGAGPVALAKETERYSEQHRAWILDANASILRIKAAL